MTLSDASTSFRIQLVRPKELLLQRNVLRNLNDLINDTYNAHHRLATSADRLFDTPRIGSEDQLIRELGEDGLIALLFDDSTDGHESKYGQLVATGAMKPWSGTVVEAFYDGKLVNGEKVGQPFPIAKPRDGAADATWDWEITTCASVDDIKYRRAGLVTRCVDTMLQELLARRESQYTVSDSKSSLPQIKFWVSALVGIGNQEYWERRGYELEGPIKQAPKGAWNAKRDFEIATLSKVVA